MRILHVLLPMLVWMSVEADADAQSVAVATATLGPSATTNSGTVAPQPTKVPFCGVWREACAGDDRNKMLLLLGVMSTTKLPLVIR